MRGLLDREQHRLDAIRSRPVLARPHVMVEPAPTEVTALRERAGRSLDHRISAAGAELRHTVARLRALSPAATLDRGYAIVQGRSGHVVRAATEVAKGDVLRVRLARGELSTTVDEASEENR